MALTSRGHRGDYRSLLRGSASWEFTVGASTRIGKDANMVQMPPPTYNKTDLRLHLADGQVVGYSNKVKVSGTMYYTSSVGQAERTRADSPTRYSSSAAVFNRQ